MHILSYTLSKFTGRHRHRATFAIYSERCQRNLHRFSEEWSIINVWAKLATKLPMNCLVLLQPAYKHRFGWSKPHPVLPNFINDNVQVWWASLAINKIYRFTFKGERKKSSESCFDSVRRIKYFSIIWYYFIVSELPIYVCNNNNNNKTYNLKNIYTLFYRLKY